MSKTLWHLDSVVDWPPEALISVARADRASVRMGVRAPAFVPRVVQQLQRLGSPPPLQAPTPAARAACPLADQLAGITLGPTEPVAAQQAANHAGSPPQLSRAELLAQRAQQVPWLRLAAPAPAAAAAGGHRVLAAGGGGGEGSCAGSGGGRVVSPQPCEPRQRLEALRSPVKARTWEGGQVPDAAVVR